MRGDRSGKYSTSIIADGVLERRWQRHYHSMRTRTESTGIDIECSEQRDDIANDLEVVLLRSHTTRRSNVGRVTWSERSRVDTRYSRLLVDNRDLDASSELDAVLVSFLLTERELDVPDDCLSLLALTLAAATTAATAIVFLPLTVAVRSLLTPTALSGTFAITLGSLLAPTLLARGTL